MKRQNKIHAICHAEQPARQSFGADGCEGSRNHKTIFLAGTIFILILFSYPLHSQSILNLHENKISLKSKPPIDVSGIKPDLILSVTGGFSFPLADLKGDLNTVSSKNTATSSRAYFEQWGFNAGLQAQLPVDKKSRLRVTMSLIYNQFTNSGIDSSGATSIEPNLNFIQFGLGAEWAFTSISDITPYINIEANANIFGGSINFTDINSGLSYSADYNPDTRYGFTAAAGVEKTFNRTFGGYLGIKYCMANVLGKAYDPTGARELDDESFTANGFQINAKTISFVGVYLGFSLYIRD